MQMPSRKSARILCSKQLDAYILSEPSMREASMEDIRQRIHLTFRNRAYRQRLERDSNANWLNMDVAEALEQIESFLNEL